MLVLFFFDLFLRYSGTLPTSKWLRAMSHIGSQTICKPQRNSWGDTSFYVSVGQFVYWVGLFCVGEQRRGRTFCWLT